MEKHGRGPPLPAPVRRVFYLSAEGTGHQHEVFPPPNPRLLAQVDAADAIVYGMGSLYTSICPSLVLQARPPVPLHALQTPQGRLSCPSLVLQARPAAPPCPSYVFRAPPGHMPWDVVGAGHDWNMPRRTASWCMVSEACLPAAAERCPG